jgi:penicillin-binding protein 2
MNGKKGAAVAMDPRTGAILALVSYPSYDDNVFSNGISQKDYTALASDPNQPLFNRAISAHYPTGSTIKPLEASAALQEKIISPDKLINDPGYILVKSQYDPSITYRYGGVEAHGLVDMKKALAVSSNIYFYTVGGGYGDQQGLGPTRIKKYLSLFGWDQKTGIDLPGEYSGFIPDPAWKKATKGSSWVDGDTYNMSIGQSDLQTTPLQEAAAYCAIANGGTLYKPQIVNKIITPSAGSGQVATVVQQLSPEIIRSGFIDPANLQIVMQGMRDGVTQSYGLSKSLNNLPVPVAAKTGTAEIGLNNYYNVWSTVIAPYDNPQIVLVVTAENVQGLGAVTLPVAHDVLQWYFSGKK